MPEEDRPRIASSELAASLLGPVEEYQMLLHRMVQKLMHQYPDAALHECFRAIPSRIICLAPMALCASLVKDLGLRPSETLLTGIGLACYEISTHDDVVDELPRERPDIAALVYAGNIVTLEGIRVLIDGDYGIIADAIIEYINLNHCYQTTITRTIWSEPTDEAGYLAAIGHTPYWVAIGLMAAITFCNRSNLRLLVIDFSEWYGMACQLFDDMREIDDDLQHGYWSLPIIMAREQELNLRRPEDKNWAIARSCELAIGYLDRATQLCIDQKWSRLGQLVARIRACGETIQY